jgi:hypothetical protein
VSIWNQLQMKLMKVKVNGNLKNKMNQEFKQDEELWRIWSAPSQTSRGRAGSRPAIDILTNCTLPFWKWTQKLILMNGRTAPGSLLASGVLLNSVYLHSIVTFLYGAPLTRLGRNNAFKLSRLIVLRLMKSLSTEKVGFITSFKSYSVNIAWISQ